MHLASPRPKGEPRFVEGPHGFPRLRWTGTALAGKDGPEVVVLRARWLALGLAACAAAPGGDAPADDTDPTDDTSADGLPRCELGGPCAVLAPAPEVQPCGADLRDALADPGWAGTRPPWPERLSALGCFDDLKHLTPSPTITPYTLMAPLWSDGADKGRWLSLATGTTLTFTPDGPWIFPENALLLKAFGTAGPTPRDLGLIELRAMLRWAGRWHFATWRWDADLADGVLVPVAGAYGPATVAVDGEPTEVSWWYPSLVGCETCHRNLADQVLGPRTAQLSKDVRGNGQIADQLVALTAAGLLTGVPEARDDLFLLPDPYGDAPADDRARAWLHAQCAHCHQPGGFVSPEVLHDLRFATPLSDAHLCREPKHGSYGERDAVVVEPGDPDASLLVQRLEVEGVYRMPPGTLVGDREGIALVRAWIEGMDGCP